MAKDYMYLGSTPSGEDCAQVGSPDYETRAKKECHRYIACLRDKYGDEPDDAQLLIKKEPHDFGFYYEVVCQFDPDSEIESAYAFQVEEGLETWPDDERPAKQEITMTRITDAIRRRETELDNPGFCLSCGAESDACEPDARKYQCLSCGEHNVFGAEEVLMMLG